MFDVSSAPAFDSVLALGPPTPESVVMLLGTDPNSLAPADAVAYGIGAEKVCRFFEGLQLRSLSVAAGGKRLDGELNDVGQELAAATGLHPVTASTRTDLGCSATSRLPTALKQLEAGVLLRRQVEKLELATRELTDDQARAVDADAVPGGPRGLNRRIAAAISRTAPEHVKKKTEQQRRSRSVLPWSDPIEGVAGLGVQGPLDQVAQLKAAIDLDARTRITGECRPLAARRFDVLYDWARNRLGLPPANSPDRPTPPTDNADNVAAAATAPAEGGPAAGSPAERRRCGSCGRSGPNTIPINVTVSLETLLGLSELPGDLDGAPIPAQVARELAADGRWRRWVVESTTGRLLDVGSATYRPSAELDRFIRGRDRTCRFPSCTMPAIRCDLDHTVAFHTQGGTTCQDNLVALCRTHHRLKHEHPWTYQLHPNGDVTWTTPTGRTYTDPAEDHYDDPVLSDHLAKIHTRERARIERDKQRQQARTRITPANDPWAPPPDGDPDDEDLPF